ncbi:MAG: hypothetical protein AAFU64_10130, partial [Bacteroidota bacterium]
MKKLFVFFFLYLSSTLMAQELEVALKNGTEAEKAAKAQLERIYEQFQEQIKDWIFTYQVIIAERAIPHSHPVLTLNSRYLKDDLKQLSTFLHEQFH